LLVGYTLPLPLVLAYHKIQNEVDHEHDDKPLIAWLLFNRKNSKISTIFLSNYFRNI